MAETFSAPDDHGPITMSDVRAMDKAKGAAHAHEVAVVALLVAAGILVFLVRRFLFAPTAAPLRRRLARWISGSRGR